jgi:hypothetical protein
MKANYHDELTGLKCAICGSELNEGYFLEPEFGTDEYEILEEKFGEPANWTIGECCFGGYCGAILCVGTKKERQICMEAWCFLERNAVNSGDCYGCI